jgi:hypothetical protein
MLFWPSSSTFVLFLSLLPQAMQSTISQLHELRATLFAPPTEGEDGGDKRFEQRALLTEGYRMTGEAKVRS